jgi:hypothetical protein
VAAFGEWKKASASNLADCLHGNLKQHSTGKSSADSSVADGGSGADLHVGALPPTHTCTATSIHNKFSRNKGGHSLPGGRM